MARTDAYIPVPKDVLVAGLAARPGLAPEDAAAFPQLARLLTAVLHHEALESLEALHAAYRPVSPDPAYEAMPATSDQARAFTDRLESVLARANFTERTGTELMPGADARTLQNVRLKASEQGIRRTRFYVRGTRPEVCRVRHLWLLQREVHTEIFDDVVMVIALKSEGEYGAKEGRSFARLRHGARPGAVLLRHFRAVPRVDLPGLHPGASAAMRRSDQLMIGVPAIAGAIPLVGQLWSALLVLGAVLAAAFGVASEFSQSDLQRAIAALSGLVAIGAFVMRQHLKYSAQRLKYQKRLADTVYFHTAANNAVVIDGLVGEGERQDAKEAVLAWWVLRARGPLSRAELDTACEGVLREQFGVTLDFEIGDALARLERLGLVEGVGSERAAVDAPTALARLTAFWDGFFVTAKPDPATPRAVAITSDP
jgi:hypothetical protein